MRIYSSVSSISHNILDFFSITDKSSAFRSEVQLKTTLMQKVVLVMGGKNGDYPGYRKNLLHPAVIFLMKSKGKAEAFSDYKLAWQQKLNYGTATRKFSVHFILPFQKLV